MATVSYDGAWYLAFIIVFGIWIWNPGIAENSRIKKDIKFTYKISHKRTTGLVKVG